MTAPRATVALTCVSVLLAAEAAHAELIALGRWDGALEGAIELTDQRTLVNGVPHATFSSTELAQQVTIRNSGLTIIDPQLLTMTLGGTFGLPREWSGSDRPILSSEGAVSGYQLLMNFLEEQATSLSLFAILDQTLLSRAFGGENVQLRESHGATLTARRLPLPSVLTLRQEFSGGESKTGGIETIREDERLVLTYEGRRGWMDSEASVRYEVIDATMTTGGIPNHQSQETSAQYGLDFGPELNRHFMSHARYFTRQGADLTTLLLNEALGVAHTEKLGTRHQYLLNYTNSLGAETTTHTGTTSLSYQWWDNLGTTIGAEGIANQLQSGQRHSIGSVVDLDYSKRLPGRGQLRAGVGNKFKLQDQRFDSSISAVAQESHVLTSPFAEPVLLANGFVLEETIVVTKIALGPVPPGCAPTPEPPIPLVLGRDYQLQSVGDFTQLLPLGCSGTSPGANPGDTLAIDYQFGTSPDMIFTTASWRIDVTADYRWIRPYISQEFTEQTLLEGRDDGQLDTQRGNSVGVELREGAGRLRSGAVAELIHLDSNRTAYDGLRSHQYVTWSIRRDLILSFNAEQSRLDFDTPAHAATNLTASTSLSFAPTPSLSLVASATVRGVHDTLLPDGRSADITVGARWTIRQLDIHPTLEWFDRRQGDTDTQSFRIFLRMVRRF